MSTKPVSSIKATSQKRKKAATARKRINFSQETVKQIAFEAHLFCSNPECCRFTSYSTSTGKARAIAEAAHINAASDDGPRPGDVRTEAYLNSLSNGIWLCKNCHDRIDDDPHRFPENLLRTWKTEHSEFVRKLVGKDFDLAHFELYSRSRNTAQCISFLTFIENRRVFFEALDAEFPDQVLQSLMEVRQRMVEARSSMMKGTMILSNLEEMRRTITAFLTANPRLNELKCDAGDPDFQRFYDGLTKLRAELLPRVTAIANEVGHQLSPEMVTEARRIGIY